MSATRQCHVDGCMNRHAREYLFCRTHWYRLPAELRDAVYYNLRKHGVFSNGYMQAAENALAFLEDRDPKEITVFTDA